MDLNNTVIKGGRIVDIQAYLDRIGYTGTREVSRENLTRLIRQHLETVPFENLDCCYKGAPLTNDPEVVFEKVVLRRRGGICFELNGLLYALLTALGYSCHAVAVRLPRPDGVAPVCHQGVVVTLEGKQYYCDVGFGGPGPKGALPLDEGEQLVDGERFRVVREGVYVSIRRCNREAFSEVIRYADLPCIWQDFTGLLYHYAMAPDSYFVTQRLVNLCLPDGGSLALTDNRFTARRGGSVIRKELGSEEEAAAILEREFGIIL